MFEKATNFDELFKIIQEKKEVIGADGWAHSANYLMETIGEVGKIAEELQKNDFITAGSEDEIRSDLNDEPDFRRKIRCITRTEGLREKVFELIIKEVMVKGISEESNNTIIPKTPDKG